MTKYYCKTPCGIIYRISENSANSLTTDPRSPVKLTFVYSGTLELFNKKTFNSSYKHYKEHRSNLTVNVVDWLENNLSYHGLFNSLKEVEASS